MNDAQRAGIGFWGLLQAGFILLKVAGVIDWTWMWVLSPFLAGLAIFLIGFAAILIALGVAAVIEVMED